MAARVCGSVRCVLGGAHGVERGAVGGQGSVRLVCGAGGALVLTRGGARVFAFVCVCVACGFGCEYGGALREACVFDDRRDGLCVACVCVYFRVCVCGWKT